MTKIAFVCLGNICRSPLAEVIGKDIAKKLGLNMQIHSFGTASWHIGKEPCENSQKIALRYNLDISKYRGSQITKGNINQYDLIAGADNSVVSDLNHMDYKGQIHHLGDFGYNGMDIPDPYTFIDVKDFDDVFIMIQTCVKNFLTSRYVNEIR